MRKLLLILVLSSTAAAQTYPWTGILDPSRALDWSHAGATIDPTGPRTQCGATIMPSGLTDITDATNINNAIQNCGGSANTSAGSQYVLLGPGTFYIVNGITFGANVSNTNFKTAKTDLTLRGSGPDQTDLKVLTSGNQECGSYGNAICIRGYFPQDVSGNTITPYTGTCALTSGYTRGSTQLTLGNCYSATAPQVGQLLQLDQRTDDINLTQCTSSGTTATCTVGLTTLPPEFAVGNCVGVAGTNNLGWMAAPAWQPNHAYAVNTLVRTSSGYLVFVSTAGTSGASAPTWNTNVNNTTADGSTGLVWSTTGEGVQGATTGGFWIANRAYAVNNVITDANGNIQIVTTAGTSGASAPAWSTTQEGTTSDGTGTLVWTTLGGNYNQQPRRPQSYAYPTYCNAITAVSGNTFSYALPPGLSNLAACCAYISGATNIPGPCTSANNSINGNTCGFATVDTGGVYNTGTPCVTADATCPGSYSGGTGLNSQRRCPDARGAGISCATNEVSWRYDLQTVRVLSCNTNPCASGSVITLDEPIVASNLRATQAVGVWWIAMSGYMQNDGIEDMTIDCRADGGSQTAVSMMLSHCYNCWVKGIRSIGGSRNHIWLQSNISHVTVRDSYFFDTKRGASQSYGVEMFGATDNLIENNVIIRVVAGSIGGMSANSVIGYNYLRDDGYNAVGFLMPQLIPNHGVNEFNLFESNNTPLTGYDNIHGTSGPEVHFRERARGQSIPVKNNGLVAYTISAYHRGISVIGGVAGTSGIQGNYQGLGGGRPQNVCATSIMGSSVVWCIGMTAQNSNVIPDDPLLWQSLLRWGNYDVATGAARWCGNSSSPGWSTTCGSASEVPGAFFALPANPVPATTTLPASFYLTSKPVWYATKWGTPPWPSIGPDVTGGNEPVPDGTGDTNGEGLVHQIPAGVVAANAPWDTPLLLQNNYATGGTWSGTQGSWFSVATITGRFTLPLWGTFLLQGMTPSEYNGKFMVLSLNGPTPDAGITTSTVAGIGNPGIPGTKTYRMKFTRVNDYGETEASAIDRRSVASTCPTSGSCSLQINGPCIVNSAGNSCLQNGLPAYSTGNTYATKGYNVYFNDVSDPSGKFCLQNTAPITTTQSATQFTNYVQSTLPITPLNPELGACIEPPTTNTAISSVLTYYLGNSPGGNASPGTCVSQCPMTTPLIQVFNAEQYYYGAAPPQVTTPPGITGHGTITGNGKIT